jgi:hypothetical protein
VSEDDRSEADEIAELEEDHEEEGTDSTPTAEEALSTVDPDAKVTSIEPVTGKPGFFRMILDKVKEPIVFIANDEETKDYAAKAVGSAVGAFLRWAEKKLFKK